MKLRIDDRIHVYEELAKRASKASSIQELQSRVSGEAHTAISEVLQQYPDLAKPEIFVRHAQSRIQGLLKSLKLQRPS